MAATHQEDLVHDKKKEKGDFSFLFALLYFIGEKLCRFTGNKNSGYSTGQSILSEKRKANMAASMEKKNVLFSMNQICFP